MINPCADRGRTLIDSTPGVHNAWATFAKDYDLNTAEVAQATHGRRLYDTLKEWCHIDDEEKLQVGALLMADFSAAQPGS